MTIAVPTPTHEDAQAVLRAAYAADVTSHFDSTGKRYVFGNAVTAHYHPDRGVVELSSNVWTLTLEDIVREAGLNPETIC